MITRRKIMAYLAGMFGAGVTGAQAGLDTRPPLPMDLFKEGLRNKARLSLFNAATMLEQIEDMLERLGEPENAGKSAYISNTAIAEGWGGDVYRMLADLPVPPYVHRVFYCVSTESVLVERPAADGSYWADESKVWMRLR